MDNKKSGIRVMHLQHPQQQNKRSESPLNINRKKIFEKPMNPQHFDGFIKKNYVKQEPEKYMKNDSYQEFNRSREFQQLVEALKKKSIQNEQKDEVILKLQKRINILEKDLERCETQIQKMKSSNSYLQKNQKEKLNNYSKDLNQSSNRNNDILFQSFNGSPLKNYESQKNNQDFRKPFIQTISQVSNERQYDKKRAVQNTSVPIFDSKSSVGSEILSPFNALSERKKTSNIKLDLDKEKHFNIIMQKAKIDQGKNFSFHENKNREFSNSEIKRYPNSKPQQFNIFGQKEEQQKSRRKDLTIEDSKIFKFDDFNPNSFEFGDSQF